jgi:hypothetical protein
VDTWGDDDDIDVRVRGWKRGTAVLLIVAFVLPIALLLLAWTFAALGHLIGW